MSESDLEMTTMLSRAAERVGLDWRPPPCTDPSRLDDWFLGVACAGFQHPAPCLSSGRCMGTMIIAQVCLRLATVKGHSKICSFTALGGPKTSQYLM